MSRSARFSQCRQNHQSSDTKKTTFRDCSAGRAGMAGPSVAYVREHLADVKAWLAAGRRLRVWTVDEREDAEFLLAQGVQELTTNRPEDVLRWVRERAAARRERVPTGA